MTISDTQPPSNPPRSGADYATDTEAGARKRREVGLSERRETAPVLVQRPPDADPRIGQWLLVFFLVLLILSLFMLVATRTMDPSRIWGTLVTVTLPKLQADIQTQPAEAAPPFVVVPPGYELWLTQDFSNPGLDVNNYTVPGQLAGAVLPDLGVYRLDVWPGQIGWTLFDITELPAYRFETSVTIDVQTPASSAGLVGRFQEAGSFYLFTVDTDGRVAADLWKDGQQFTLQPPTNVAVVNPVGKPNRLALEDDGQQLRFFVNQALLFTVPNPQLPPGRPGLTALSTGDQIGSASFDWVAIYTKQQLH